MPFYLRKSLRAGPFRFNISKSGVGVSAGVTGFRLGSGPRGNYVHMGRHGLYYRETLSSGKSRSHSRYRFTPSSPEDSSAELPEVESANISELQDSSSQSLLAELNSKYKRPFYLPFVVLFFLLALLTLFLLKVSTWIYVTAIIVAVIGIVLTYLRDQAAKTVILFYELEGKVESAYQSVHDAFQEIRECSRIWHVPAQGQVNSSYERKIQAGANTLVRRVPTSLCNQAPGFISTNIAIPTIPAGRQLLFFFPDRLLVLVGKTFGAVSYSDLHLDVHNTRFIESDALPADAKVVDSTWQYVNRDGGPDRRFRYNKQLPIASYGELCFTSSSGLNELFQVSRPEIGTSLVQAINQLASTLTELGSLTPHPSSDSPDTSAPRSSPTQAHAQAVRIRRKRKYMGMTSAQIVVLVIVALLNLGVLGIGAWIVLRGGLAP